jgi:hypothetical protein
MEAVAFEFDRIPCHGIGIMNRGNVAMPHAIRAFRKQMESTPEVRHLTVRGNVHAGQRRKPDRAQR